MTSPGNGKALCFYDQVFTYLGELPLVDNKSEMSVCLSVAR